MSLKNAMINIQKYYSIHIGPIWSNLSTWSYLVDIGPIRSYLFLLGPHWLTLSYSIHFGPPCSHSVHFVLFGPFVFSLVHLDHFDSFWSTLVHFYRLVYMKKTCLS